MKPILLSLLACAALTAPAFAQGDFEGRRALMRQCTEVHKDSPNLPAVGVGAFCTCYVDELLGDSAQRPEVYFDEGPKKNYYSSKEEGEKTRAREAAFQSHVSYCRTVLQ